jgi:CIC family chloride channel protein
VSKKESAAVCGRLGDGVTRQKPRLLLEVVGLGIIGALAARVFTWMLRLCSTIFLKWIAGYQPPGLPNDGGALQATIGTHGLWLIPLSTTLGGLLSGLLVYLFAPEAEGHGTDAAVAAFHRTAGYIRARVAPIKMVASAITIGSGGSAGREGPIALITAGVGSVYATLLKRSEQERSILLLAGMAAGLAAIFRTPIGTAVFAIEVLYGGMEFETSALLYTLVASGVAYSVNGIFVGFKPLFSLSFATAPQLSQYGWYLAMGACAGVVASVLPSAFYGMRDAFKKLPIPTWTKPGLGGLGVGLLALELPQVLGGGYGWIQLAMRGELALKLLLILVGAKLLAFALTVSSGGSGGVFAPSLFVGAMLGGACATLFHQPPAIFVVVGMAAVFGAAARVPIATMLMVTEMAGGYQLLVPAGFAVMVSYLLQVQLSRGWRYGSLYEAQVPLREDSPAHYLDHIRVALTLLGQRKLSAMDEVGHLNLLRLLRAKVRFDLPAGRQLQMGALVPTSRFVNGSIGDLYVKLGLEDVEIVALIRREHFVLPHTDTLLEGNDRLMLISTAASREALRDDISDLVDDHEIAPL